MDTQSSNEEPESQLSQRGARPKSRMALGLLIEAVQQYPYLYDLSHKVYKDAKKKQLAWQQIANLLKCSVDDCMKAWKNARDRFVKEKISVGVSGAEAWKLNWPYYNDMLFYTTFTRTRNTYTATARKVASQSQRSQLTGRQSRPSTRSSSSVWSAILMGALTSPEPENQDENVPPSNIL